MKTVHYKSYNGQPLCQNYKKGMVLTRDEDKITCPRCSLLMKTGRKS